MKIKHSITRTGSTLHGYILETIFEEGEKRGDKNKQYTKDKKIILRSSIFPQLTGTTLFVHGASTADDTYRLSYIYPSEQEAQQALDYINEFSVDSTTIDGITFSTGGRIMFTNQMASDSILIIGAEPIQIEYVYASNESEENALQIKQKRILITKLPGKAIYTYICVSESDEDRYSKGEEYNITMWRYAVAVPTDEKKLRQLYLTDEEFEKLNILLLK